MRSAVVGGGDQLIPGGRGIAKFAEAAGDEVPNAGESAADDEQDVAGIDGVRLDGAAAAHGGHGALELAGDVIRGDERDIAVLHELEEIGLDAAAGDIASARFTARGELVHFIEIDDTVRGLFHIAIGAADEVADEIIHVAAHITRLAELGGVRLHKRHADEFGGGANEMRFAHAGGAEQQDVLFLIKGRGLARQRHAHVLEMIAQRDAENFLGLALADDEASKVARNIGGLEVEAEFGRRRRGGFGDAVLGGGVVLGAAAARGRNASGDGAEVVRVFTVEGMDGFKVYRRSVK